MNVRLLEMRFALMVKMIGRYDFEEKDAELGIKQIHQ